MTHSQLLAFAERVAEAMVSIRVAVSAIEVDIETTIRDKDARD